MKKINSVISCMIAAIFIFNSSVFAMKDSNYYAGELNRLGLFMGTDNGYELDKTFTREQAATMLVRLRGKEDVVKNTKYIEMFGDVPVDKWSFPYVMYCFYAGITKGTGEDTFSPEKEISSPEFLTLVLRLLGYTDTEPENAFDKAVETSLLMRSAANNLKNSNVFTRGDMVYVIYRSLQVMTPDEEILADKLKKQGIISEGDAEKFDVYKSTDNIDSLIDKMFD